MKIFIDTADIKQIEEALQWGVIDGVTTNPSHVSKTGRPAADVYRDICGAVKGPVSLETIALDAPGIIKEGRALAALGENVVVKVVNTVEGLKAVRALSSEGIKTNVTVTFSPTQALLAAKCGATYVSPFVGRLDMFGHVGMELVRQIRTIYTNYGYKTEIIVAAVRHQTHVLESALCGADVCTMACDIIRQMFEHPLTEIGIQNFLNDWKKVPLK
ncbi:MAG: fructose-6-phosphate aldolase [Opitutaceae bacterium]|jgi:transaldolase|nr:fructose-6-phosphate aldolase [Opitutaceae bacterium]